MNRIGRVWSSEFQYSFDRFKTLISKDPVLAMYDPEQEVIVRIDASQDGEKGGVGMRVGMREMAPLGRTFVQKVQTVRIIKL